MSMSCGRHTNAARWIPNWEAPHWYGICSWSGVYTLVVSSSCSQPGRPPVDRETAFAMQMTRSRCSWDMQLLEGPGPSRSGITPSGKSFSNHAYHAFGLGRPLLTRRPTYSYKEDRNMYPAPFEMENESASPFIRMLFLSITNLLQLIVFCARDPHSTPSRFHTQPELRVSGRRNSMSVSES
jgi:hypothetical protein